MDLILLDKNRYKPVIFNNIRKLVLEELSQEQIIKDMAINRLIDIEIYLKYLNTESSTSYHVEHLPLKAELRDMDKPSDDELKQWVDKIQTDKLLALIYVQIESDKVFNKLLPIKDYIKEVCCQKFNINPEEFVNDERYEFMKKNASLNYKEYKATDTSRYNIEDNDWLEAVDFINKGKAYDKVLSICKKDMRKKLAFYFIFKKLGFLEGAKYLKQDILSFHKLDERLTQAQLDAYENKYANLQIPTNVQDIIDDLMNNAPKSHLAMFYKDDNYVILPHALKKYLLENSDIISYKITYYGSISLLCDIELETLYGKYFFIFYEKIKQVYGTKYMCLLCSEDDYCTKRDRQYIHLRSITDVVYYLNNALKEIKSNL